jgi:hypothetical protein
MGSRFRRKLSTGFEQMSRRRQINADPGGHRLRRRLASASLPLRDVGGFLEERLLWPLVDFLRAVVDLVRWPLERIAWVLERRLVWPLGERAAGLGLPRPSAGAAALGLVAVGAIALGVVLTTGGEDAADPVAAPPVTVAAPAATEEPEPSGPVLEGVPPSFGVGEGVELGGAGTDVDAAAASSSADDATSVEAAEGTLAEAGGDATATSSKVVPVGPAAMTVARRFAEAFVLYEVGEQPERAAEIFERTATPQLAVALAERPPRLPASGEVPKARVLNLVPGPRRGNAYTVSASLLRVGVTSELRLKMKRRAGAWLVTDVRG